MLTRLSQRPSPTRQIALKLDHNGQASKWSEGVVQADPEEGIHFLLRHLFLHCLQMCWVWTGAGFAFKLRVSRLLL